MAIQGKGRADLARKKGEGISPESWCISFPFLSSFFPVASFQNAVRQEMLAPKIVVRRGDGGGLKTKKAG
jgi:hypothetical protein